MSGWERFKIPEAKNVIAKDCEQFVASLLVSADSVDSWIVADDAGGH
ncbi:MAG: hypothetical protein ABSG74_06570 [Candidatus Bathyarchaeia archaeon]|jgi:hypothetical protein